MSRALLANDRASSALRYEQVNSALPTIGITYNKTFPVDDGIVRDALDGLALVRMIHVPTAKPTINEEEALAAHLQGLVALIVRPGWMSRELMSRCPHLRLIALHTSGFDKVDLQGPRICRSS